MTAGAGKWTENSEKMEIRCGRSGGILEARQRKVPADQVGGQFRNECPYSEKMEIRENALRAEWGILEARQRKVPADRVGGHSRNECP